MAKNKIITSQGNVQFINSKGKTISMHPMHCYAVYQDDTVSFLFIYMKEYSGQAFFASQFEDLEVDGETYDSIDALKEAIAEAFAKAGAQARTEIVDELPETGYTNTIYLLPKEHGTGYDEYIYNEEKGWVLVGDTDIEFERYLKIEDFNPYSADTKDYIDAVSGETVANHNDIVALSGAVDTEISDREAADAVISGAVDTLSTNLSNEVSRAQNAEQTLQNNINTVNSRVDAEQLARANADNALSGAIDSFDDKIEALSGEVETMGDEAIVDAEYVSSSTTIDFYNASGAVVAQVDATDFIKDGMIEDVRIEEISGVTYLVIDFNTASGIEDIQIPLTDFFNPDNYYDKDAIDGIVSGLNEDISEKLAISDFNTYSGAVETALGNKVETSDFETYSGAVDTVIASKFDASGITAYSTSQEVTAEIEAAVSGKADADDVYTKSEVYTKGEVDSAIAQIDLSDYYTSAQTDSKIAEATSGKVDTTAFTAYSASVETALGNKADLSALTEDERVWGESLNDINGRINTISGNALSTGDVQTQIDSSISGKVDTSAFTSHTSDTSIHHTSTSAVTSGSTSVITSGGVYQQLGGLKLVKITQSAYDNLQNKDANTLYIISD